VEGESRRRSLCPPRWFLGPEEGDGLDDFFAP
jgi:hypothetical protein